MIRVIIEVADGYEHQIRIIEEDDNATDGSLSVDTIRLREAIKRAQRRAEAAMQS